MPSGAFCSAFMCDVLPSPSVADLARPVHRYFTEVGIGTHRDEREALQWFRRAAEHGDKRAIARLRSLTNGAENYPSPPTSPTSPTSGSRGGASRNSSLHPGQGRKSRRATLLGMTNGGSKEKDNNNTNATAAAPHATPNGTPVPIGKSSKKADGDCVIA